MEVSELRDIALDILELSGYENVYVYVNGERVNILDITGQIDNGFINIFVTTASKENK